MSIRDLSYCIHSTSKSIKVSGKLYSKEIGNILFRVVFVVMNWIFGKILGFIIKKRNTIVIGYYYCKGKYSL